MFTSFAAAGVLGLVLAATPVTGSAGAAGVAGCDPAVHSTTVRAVTGHTSVGITRWETRAYRHRTVIASGTVIAPRQRGILRARVTRAASATVPRATLYRAVVRAYAHHHPRSTLREHVGSTRHESRLAKRAGESVTVPAGTRVVWFVAHPRVHGEFGFSTCDHVAGGPPDRGRVHWHTARWSSFGFRADGGVRCDLATKSSITTRVKQTGC